MSLLILYIRFTYHLRHFVFINIVTGIVYCMVRQQAHIQQVTGRNEYPFMHAHGSPRLAAGHLDALLREELHEGAGGREYSTVNHRPWPRMRSDV